MTPVADILGHPRFAIDLNAALLQQGAHIYLGQQRRKPEGQVLQKTLQALGCKVTNRMTIS